MFDDCRVRRLGFEMVFLYLRLSTDWLFVIDYYVDIKFSKLLLFRVVWSNVMCLTLFLINYHDWLRFGLVVLYSYVDSISFVLIWVVLFYYYPLCIFECGLCFLITFVSFWFCCYNCFITALTLRRIFLYLGSEHNLFVCD